MRSLRRWWWLLGVVCLPLGAQTPPRWGLNPDLRIGNPKDRNYAFTGVSGIVAAPNGGVLVLELAAAGGSVRLYDRTGRFVRRIVGPGLRSGDFKAGDGVSIGTFGDTIWMWNRAARRVTLFGRDTTVVKTFTVNTASVVLSDGSLLMDPARLCNATVQASSDSGIITRIDRQGRRLNDVARLWPGACPSVVTAGAQRISIDQPFEATSLWNAQPGGATITVVDQRDAPAGSQATFRVRRLRADGGVIFDKTYAYGPLPVTQAAWDSAIADLLADANLSGASFQGAVRTTMPKAASEPTISRLMVSSDGSTWLQREQLSSARRNLWTVIDPTGTLVGEVVMPAGFIPATVDAGVVWGLEGDAEGNLSIVRLRVQRPAA